MITLADNLRERLPTDVFTDTEVSALVPGSAHARYGLIKRAIGRGDIIQLRRGVYGLGRRYQRQRLNLFEIAQRIYSPSYVSSESALSYHGWIPEAAYTVTSVCAKRSREFETPLGLFDYTRVPRFNFVGVDRIVDGRAIFLIAGPTKAIADYVWLHRIERGGIREIAESLRIDQEHLRQISGPLLAKSAEIYGSKRVTRFARAAARELWP